MPPRMRRRRSAVLASAATLLAATAGTAAADTRTTGTASPAVPATTVTTTATTPAQQEQAVAYWTPERMESAVPVRSARPARAGVPHSPQGLTPDSTTPDSTARVRSAPGAVAAHTVERGTRRTAPRAQPIGVPWTRGGPVTTVTGKIFFVRDGGRFVCSGTSVQARNRSTVVTAGHCLTENGDDSTQLVFVPGYVDGRAPHGTWPATTLAPAPPWRDNDQSTPEATNHDVGFAVVAARSDGKRLADVVGAFPLGFDQPAGQRTAVFGYPAASPYDGERLQYCTGPRFPDTTPRSTDEGTRCFMTGGSSGGPWLSAFDGRTGTVTSVVSFSYVGSDEILYGPRFDDEVRKLHAAVSG